ncbi:MAG: Eco57I restriction-modification methylase domain-containing protein [Firmicutes bacterium]|nr:Eco57I restriction-modification methylase domain-containing protein [Bacillota bacterium]
MEKLIDISSYPVANVLDLLLKDKSTKKNIIWATDTYEEYGEGFTDKVQMNAKALLRRTDIIRPRIQKSQEAQAERTRKKAEVFTPAWLCNRMNNHCDEDWFGRKDVFNSENEDHTWTVTKGRIEFPKRKKWQHYVDSRRLEITCGEAPYLISRYDVSTGELIVPPIKRIGMLDRKLRIVNENTDSYDDWLKWTIRAFEASYGYEYQGDNVLIARINLLMTFVDHFEERWERQPDDKLLRQLANKIAWNIWQMDGLKDTVPLGKPYEEFRQLTISDMLGLEEERKNESEAIPCRIFNWRSNASVRFMDLKEISIMGKKLFDYVIGNPPYNADFEDSGDNGNYAKPVYNDFIDAVNSITDRVELVHPARFLFNAGSTPKAWNEKMLNDPHFKVLSYQADSSKVFSNTDIKGGIAITYRDINKDFGSIGTFTAFEELNSMMKKVVSSENFCSIMDNIFIQIRFNLDEVYITHPEIKAVIGSDGKDRRFEKNIFVKAESLFTTEKVNEDDIKVIGILKQKRVWRYIPRKYVDLNHENLLKYKVIIPASNGSGAIGEVLSTPLIGEPLIGYTRSFIGICSFDTETEAQACLKYIKSKFSRACLGILKITQMNNKDVWKYVPLQDFTADSDIDWSRSIHEIDLQLYRKYGLDEKEIEFIETHVKEMA